MSSNSNDNKLYRTIWYCITVAFISVVISCNKNSTESYESKNHEEQVKYQVISNTNAAISALIAQGVEPKNASCAILIGNGYASSETKIYCATQQPHTPK